MNFIVSEETKRATTKCKSGFSCLSGFEKKDLCPVESAFTEKSHFIKCLYDSQCTYQRPFGYGKFCTCPIRMEIYSKYSI